MSLMMVPLCSLLTGPQGPSKKSFVWKGFRNYGKKQRIARSPKEASKPPWKPPGSSRGAPGNPTSDNCSPPEAAAIDVLRAPRPSLRAIWSVLGPIVFSGSSRGAPNTVSQLFFLATSPQAAKPPSHQASSVRGPAWGRSPSDPPTKRGDERVWNAAPNVCLAKLQPGMAFTSRPPCPRPLIPFASWPKPFQNRFGKSP